MKKTVLRSILAAGFIVLLSSCFSIPKTFTMTFDEEYPADKSTVITFVNNTENGWFHVEEYNGIAVAENIYQGKSWGSNDKTVLTVPAGKSAFVFEVRYTFSNRYSMTTFLFENVGFEYGFEAGKQYEIKGVSKSAGLFKGYNFFVGIYDVTEKSTLLHEWQLERE